MKRNIIQKVAALGLVAASSDVAFAQSVLERVLGQINNATNLAPVNGTYANIAENLGGSGVVDIEVENTYEVPAVTEADTLQAGDRILIGYAYLQDPGDTIRISGATGAGDDDLFADGEAVYAVAGASGVDFGQVTWSDADGDDLLDLDNRWVVSRDRGSNYANEISSGDRVFFGMDGSVADIGYTIALGVNLYEFGGDLTAAATFDGSALQQSLNTITPAQTITEMVLGLLEVPGLKGIDGSISNVIDGITDATQTATAGVVNAVEYNMPTLNFGNMATTALGAVNTGEITLGVDSTVEEAKSTTAKAISAALAQIGGSADTGAIVLNVASNMTGVNGSITNTMTEVNGTIGNLSTTALGAVNTGTIVSGVNTTVRGIVGTTVQ